MFLYVGGMPGESIGIWELSGPDHTATPAGEAIGLHSPSFLCAHPILPLLYAAERRWSADEDSSGAISVLGIDPASGALDRRARVRSAGAFTAHVSISADGRHLAAANPRGPTIAVWRLNEAGLPDVEPQVVRHAGRGATPRQAEPWPHSTFFTPDGRRLLACDLALDRVFIHKLGEGSAPIMPAEQPMVQVNSGAGARHLAQSADGRFFYVVNELDSTVSVFARDPEAGRFGIVQTQSTTESHSAGLNQPAEVVLTPCGRLLMVSNRGANTVARFRIDDASGRLTALDQVSTLGENPRHIALDQAGKVLAVCNQTSSTVQLFRLDGMATPRPAASIPFANPTCAVLWSHDGN